MITVLGTIAELDGDEMTRVMWADIKERLLFPYLNMTLDYYDLGLPHRDETSDQVTADAAHAIVRHGVGVKCATITADAARVAEYGLKQMWRSPNATIRHIVGGVVFREPIVVGPIPKPVPGWTSPIVIARHANADQYQAQDFRVPGPGTLTLTFTPSDGSESITKKVVDFGEHGGVALGMYNTIDSITDFAHACFAYALSRQLPLYLSTKNTILQAYDGVFKDIFASVFTQYEAQFAEQGLTYEHKLIDDMVAFSLRSSGGFVWAAKNYDGDVQSDSVAQGFGSMGLMASILATSDGQTMLAEAAHGTVTSEWRLRQQGLPVSANPIATIYGWTAALTHRARLDDTPEVAQFASDLEQVCVDTVGQGKMTKDLALLMGPDHPWLTTEQFMDALVENLEARTHR